MMMKKKYLLFVAMLLPMVANAHDIEVQNGDGVTIYYNFINGGTELEVSLRGNELWSFSDEYTGSVVIPEEVTYMDNTYKVTSIGFGAFFKCAGLTSIAIPRSVTKIGTYAFMDCTGLQKVIVPDIAAWCNIIIPAIDGNPLYLAHHLYSDENTEIKDLVIPDGVTSVHSYAFSGCSALTSVTIPSSVEGISRDAFQDCTGLQKVIISDIAAWCGVVFGGETSNPLFYAHHLYSNENTEIKDLVIPDGVTSIGYYAFTGCSGLTSLTIPNGITVIGNYVFDGCSGLTSLTIPDGVLDLGSSTFRGCSGLTSLTLGNSVQAISSWAFDGCTGLTTITIPVNVTRIGNDAFGGVDLTMVVSLIRHPFTVYGPFTQNTYNKAKLYVPEGTYSAYRAMQGWREFVRISEDDPSAGISVVEDTQNYNTTIYDLNGVRQPKPKKGINIVNGKKLAIK
jgi:hypothetical protein